MRQTCPIRNITRNWAYKTCTYFNLQRYKFNTSRYLVILPDATLSQVHYRCTCWYKNIVTSLRCVYNLQVRKRASLFFILFLFRGVQQRLVTDLKYFIIFPFCVCCTLYSLIFTSIRQYRNHIKHTFFFPQLSRYS